MNSIVNVVISDIETYPDHIVLPIWLHASSDDSPNEEMPELSGVNFRVHIDFGKCTGTRQEAEERLVAHLHETYRTSFAGSGFTLLMEELSKFLSKNDLSVYGKKYIPEPASTTRH